MPSLKQLHSLSLHTDRIWQCAPHPTLPLLATCSGDRTARVVSLETFTSLSEISGGHKRSIRSVAWKPNTATESVLATGSFDATAGIWRREESGAEVGDEENDEWRFAVVLDGHESEIKGVAWSAGGSFLATCSRDKSVWIWEEMEQEDYETIAVMQEHSQDVKCVVWHPEEALLASASYDDSIRLYREDVDDWTCCTLLQKHSGTVWYLQFEPLTAKGFDKDVGSRLASASDDLTIRIWSRVKASESEKTAMPSIIRGASIEEEWVCTGILPKVHERSIYSISWSARSGRIVSCGGDGKIVVYEEAEVEIPKESTAERTESNGEDTEMQDADEQSDTDPRGREWRIVEEVKDAHGVYEINSVVWSRRFDKDRKDDEEEMVISCGDDGAVNFWEVVD